MMIFDVKPDGHRKARFVAGGHVTKDIPHQEAYALVIHAKNLWLLFLLSAINNQKLVAGDVSNAYLNARTNEQVYSIAGPEFGQYEGQIVVIVGVLYGLQSSGNRWHAKLSDSFRNLGFTPSKADFDIWMDHCKDSMGVLVPIPMM